MKTQIYNSITKENIIRDTTSEELESIKSTESSSDKKLREIRFQRNLKLSQTDYFANSDVTMPDYIKTWRQSLRDIPANNDSSKYDELLARDSDGNLTHSIWTQPTE